MGISSIDDVLDHVKKEDFRKKLTKCREEHDDLQIKILKELESEGSTPVHAATPKEPEDQVSMLDLTGQQIIAALSGITVETLTPIEAMNELYKLKKMLD